MLAASARCSNVSPDNLQPPPIVAFSTRTPERLRKYAAICRLDPNPGGPTQQYAAREQPGWCPVPIGTHDRNVAGRINPQRLAY